MSEQKHTPEPWMHLKGDEGVYTELNDGCRGTRIAVVTSIILEHQANAKRIVECVNALAGIENPAEWVRILKEERVESHVSYWKEKAENSDWRYKELQSENERLKRKHELSMRENEKHVNELVNQVNQLTNELAKLKVVPMQTKHIGCPFDEEVKS